MCCAGGMMINTSLHPPVQYGTSFYLSLKWIFFSEMIKQWWLVYNHHHASLNGFCGVYLHGEAKSYCLRCRQKWFASSYFWYHYYIQPKTYLTASYVSKKVIVKEKVLKRRMPLIRFSFISWTCWQDLAVQLYQSLQCVLCVFGFKRAF